jgi:hypothetical protein
VSAIKPQILAAISGALAAYLAEEEAVPTLTKVAAAEPPLNLWGLAARSQAMQLRLLMQRRSLR